MAEPRRDVLARYSARAGFTRLLELLPTRPVLLVLNYHRIGNADESPYEPGIYSATQHEFESHVRSVKRRFHVATLEEAIAIIERRQRASRTTVLFTFDDGYVDSHDTVTPILAAEGVQGVFFLPTSFVGTNRIPWWDAIAAIIKRSRRQTFELRLTSTHRFDLGRESVPQVIDRVSWAYKRESAEKGGGADGFIALLEEVCDAPRPEESERCFVTWDEAEAMVRAGMAIGSHTHNHVMLSRLSPAQQLEELQTSKRILEERLGISVETVSYPFGFEESFSPDTFAAAQEAGYRAGFSFYGGCNTNRDVERFDVRRVAANAPAERFQLQTTIAAVTGAYWF